MSPRVILSVFVRALPVVGPLLRRLDTVELYIVKHEAELDLLRAKARADARPTCKPADRLPVAL